MSSGKATRIVLTDFRSAPMRAFHMSWFAFFLSFFAWFGVAPLMPVIRDELALTRSQIGDTIVASVAITALARVLIGMCCDRWGPRRTYAALLVVGAVPVACMGLASSYAGFLIARLAVGVIGASFVVTQYHTSAMFAANCVGTANATSAGWGNLGGGVTQLVMPLVFAGLMSLGLTAAASWRLAMVVPALALVAVGVAYLRVTRDAPGGAHVPAAAATTGGLGDVLRDRRVWALFAVYGACFGVELTMNNVAALYFHDRFELGLAAAGAIASLFGLMNLFARTLGGWLGDRAGRRWGLRGRVGLLAAVVAAEGVALIAFASMSVLVAAVAVLIVFSVTVQMAEGATYAVVPFINRRRVGVVSGIVGAGGNAGAIGAGLMFRVDGVPFHTVFFALGCLVILCAALTALVRFSPVDEADAARELHALVGRGVAPSP